MQKEERHSCCENFFLQRIPVFRTNPIWNCLLNKLTGMWLKGKLRGTKIRKAVGRSTGLLPVENAAAAALDTLSSVSHRLLYVFLSPEPKRTVEVSKRPWSRALRSFTGFMLYNIYRRYTHAPKASPMIQGCKPCFVFRSVPHWGNPTVGIQYKQYPLWIGCSTEETVILPCLSVRNKAILRRCKAFNVCLLEWPYRFSLPSWEKRIESQQHRKVPCKRKMHVHDGQPNKDCTRDLDRTVPCPFSASCLASIGYSIARKKCERRQILAKSSIKLPSSASWLLQKCSQTM